jgi:ABC-2 type transport system ATP-binding protein
MREAGAFPVGAPMVRLEAMTRRYGPVVAASEVTFDVARGEMFGLIGPDGAGKTTTLRVVLGLLAPNAGTVRTCGLEPVAQSDALSQKIGYLSQRFSLYGDLSVDENVSFFAEIHGVPGWKARRDELLDMLRMTPFRDRLADRLSGGMKQKLALACTLIHTPELLVLDEPTTGVDPVSRRDFWRILARLQRDGLTLLLTTPYLDEAERCQRIALMDKGHILNVSTPDALRAGAREAILEILAAPKRRAAEMLQARADVADVQAFGERLHATLLGVSMERAADLGRAIAGDLGAAGVKVESVRAMPPSLEDLFIARIRAAEAVAPREVSR